MAIENYNLPDLDKVAKEITTFMKEKKSNLCERSGGVGTGESRADVRQAVEVGQQPEGEMRTSH